MTNTCRSLYPLSFALVLAGCSTAPPPATGNAALGVAEYVIADQGSELRVTGVSAAGALVAELRLVEGRYAALDGTGEAVGRQLTIKLDGATHVHESAGRAELRLPVPSERVGLFVLDVAPQLASHGVAFDFQSVSPTSSPAPEDERAYASCTTLDPSFSATCGCGSVCNVTNSGYWGGYQYVCCDWQSLGVYRLCTNNPNSSNSCGLTGPGGCAVCWSTSYPSGHRCAATADGPNCSLTWPSGGSGACSSDFDCTGGACCDGACTTYAICP